MKDAVVIGGGHNGLVAAARLAREGAEVLVLEGSSELGGLCCREEFHPGFFAPGLHHETATFSRTVARKLELQRDGLMFRESEPTWLGQDPEGRTVLLQRGTEGPTVSGVPDSEAQALKCWAEFVQVIRPLVESVLESPPPRLQPASGGELWELGKKGLGLRLLGKRKMMEFIRVLPMPAADWLQEYFEDPLLQELLAYPGVAPLFTGPRSAGSAANLLLFECSREKSVEGGPPALVGALAACCRRLGVEVRTSTPIRRIDADGERVLGVVLDSDEKISARTVIATCGPRQALLSLLAPGQLPFKTENQMRVYRCRGFTSLVRIALKSAPQFRDGETFERAFLGSGSLEGMDRVFDAAKYRRLSDLLLLDIWVPSIADPGLAEGGGHVLSIRATGTPLALEDGWDEKAKERVLKMVLERLARTDPDLPAKLIATQILTPPDLEAGYRLEGGHLYHGEQALDQLLFMRPTAEIARYRTPLEGLYLGGGGSHPGGGVSGLPGLLAAEAAIKRNL